MSQVYINDKDPNKDKIVEDFLNDFTLIDTKGQVKVALHTDSDYEVLFTKLAEEWEPQTFSEFESKVKETFNGKLDSDLEKWSKKLTLDRNRLKDVFNKM